MLQEITPISLAMPLRMGSVNCYLVKTDSGFVLIDTGSSHARAALETALVNAGCQPGQLQLILLTHGDFDHTGNAAYLRRTFGAQTAMHQDDTAMAEHGDMFANRQSANRLQRLLAPLIPILLGFGKTNRFRPDFYVADGDDLKGYGFDARVLSIPGHSLGSIGILTASGDLFCGDLLENSTQPALGSIVDDPLTAQASLAKLASLEIGTVYPGHGTPFAFAGLDQPETKHQETEEKR